MRCLYPKYKILKGVEYNKWTNEERFKQAKDSIAISCGKCFPCRLKRMKKWETRLVLEAASTIEKNGFIYFVTLTYDNPALTAALATASYNYEVQKMFKRLRHHNPAAKIKYFYVSELGDQTYRLHHHALIFSDIDILPKTSGGKLINKDYYYNTDKLTWNCGFHSVTSLEHSNFKPMIRYVIKYLIKQPLTYAFSRKIGYEKMQETANLDKGYFLLNGFMHKLPYSKNYFTNDEKIKLNRFVWSSQSNLVPREDIRAKKEIKKW